MELAQEMVKLSRHARSYIGGITHAHTILSNHPNHRESDLTIDRIAQTLRAANLAGEVDSPLQYVMLNEHPSDPAKPQKLGRLSLRGRKLLRQRRRPVIGRLPIYYGLEVSLLPNGDTDLTPRLADRCPLVIASRHGLPSATEHNPRAITKLFHQACLNPSIDVIGHPQRFIENLTGIDWPMIFQLARDSGTAIEINLNAFPRARSTPEQHDFWRRWLEALSNSKAWVFTGTDLHNQLQLETLVAEWHSLDSLAGRTDNHLAQYLIALSDTKFDPKLVVTSSLDQLTSWLDMSKPERARAILKHS